MDCHPHTVHSGDAVTTAARFAVAYDPPAAAGSDAHDPQGIGAAHVEMPDFDGPEEFLTALRQGRVTGEFRAFSGLRTAVSARGDIHGRYGC